MSTQLIFCVETNNKVQSDWMYLLTILKYFYKIDSNVKLTPIYMGSKTKYKNKEVINGMNKAIKAYRGNESKVIYCIDTDDIFHSTEDIKLNDEIANYCKLNGYDLIWFCRDIEEVFIGERIKDKEKKNSALQFMKKNKCKDLCINRVNSDKMNIHTTNLFSVIGKYLSFKS